VTSGVGCRGRAHRLGQSGPQTASTGQERVGGRAALQPSKCEALPRPRLRSPRAITGRSPTTTGTGSSTKSSRPAATHPGHPGRLPRRTRRRESLGLERHPAARVQQRDRRARGTRCTRSTEHLEDLQLLRAWIVDLDSADFEKRCAARTASTPQHWRGVEGSATNVPPAYGGHGRDPDRAPARRAILARSKPAVDERSIR